MSDTAVILAAGRGTRLAGSGDAETFSKPLMAVGGKTMLERCIAGCRAGGARRIVVVTGFRHQLIEAEVARLNRGDLETVFNPAWSKSNGMSVYAVRDHVDVPFALMMSDHVFEPSILADLLALEPAAGTVTLAIDRKIAEVFDLDDATKVLVEGDKIVQIHKQLATYNAVDCGLFLCTPAVFPALGEVVARRGDTTLSEGLEIIGARGQFLPFDIGDRWWQDVDTPEMLEQASAQLAKRGL
ncbi:MAG: NTP transferase domain-containing protein [Myxococcales bacterium]|nr:NTP transferase domain-containing protein [Myxococcales bacterium]